MEYAMRIIIPFGEQIYCSWLFHVTIKSRPDSETMLLNLLNSGSQNKLYQLLLNRYFALQKGHYESRGTYNVAIQLIYRLL